MLRIISRWIILCGAIVTAALYLNSAAFSAWVSGGPPTPYPEAWGQRALLHLCLSGVFLFGGIFIFRIIKTFPSFRRFTIVLIIVSVLLLCIPYIRAFIKSDACLDSGGRWNSLEFKCEK